MTTVVVEPRPLVSMPNDGVYGKLSREQQLVLIKAVRGILRRNPAVHRSDIYTELWIERAGCCAYVFTCPRFGDHLGLRLGAGVIPRQAPAESGALSRMSSSVVGVVSMLVPAAIRADWREERRAHLAELTTRRERTAYVTSLLYGLPCFVLVAHTAHLFIRRSA